MRNPSIVWVGLMVMVSWRPLCAQETPPAAKSESAPSAAPAAAEATAADVLAALKEVKLDAPIVLNFEAVVGPATVGYSSAKLSAAKSDTATLLHYDVESVIITQDGTRLEMQIHAKLTPRFEPLEVELRRDVIPEGGQPQTIVERAEIQEKEVVLSKISGADPATRRTVPRPASPFVFAAEFLVQRIDLKRFPKFLLHEFNAQKGTLKAHHFQSGTEPGGGVRLVSQKDDGKPGYSYLIDAAGAVQTWGEPPTPVSFKASPPDRFEEVKNLFRKR